MKVKEEKIKEEKKERKNESKKIRKNERKNEWKTERKKERKKRGGRMAGIRNNIIKENERDRENKNIMLLWIKYGEKVIIE